MSPGVKGAQPGGGTQGASPAIASPQLCPSSAPLGTPNRCSYCIYFLFWVFFLGNHTKPGSGPQVGWRARCRGAAMCPPGPPGAVSPTLPFPCSAVLWGQEALHCKAAFQDFLQQSRMRLRTGSRETCSPRGCWGHPPAAPAQVNPTAMSSAWGSSYGTNGGHRSLLLALTQHHSSHVGPNAWCKGGTGIPWVMCSDSQGSRGVTLPALPSSVFRERRRTKGIPHWGPNWGHLLSVSPGPGHHLNPEGCVVPHGCCCSPSAPTAATARRCRPVVRINGCVLLASESSAPWPGGGGGGFGSWKSWD